MTTDFVLIDGERKDPIEASISVFDIGLQRGYGCFEVLHAYAGRLFRLEAHLDRLAHSAGLLRISLPGRDDLRSWAEACAVPDGECLVRIMVTGGTEADRPGQNSHVIVFAEEVPDVPDLLQLQLRSAPWHAAGEPAELAGAKSLSYGHNVAARVGARGEGFDDALLRTPDGIVLEGPMFSIAWVKGGVIFTPSLETGVLASITRAAALELAAQLALSVSEGAFTVDELLTAEEVFAMSTVREVVPVGRIDDRTFAEGPVTKRMAKAFADLVATELALL